MSEKLLSAGDFVPHRNPYPQNKQGEQDGGLNALPRVSHLGRYHAIPMSPNITSSADSWRYFGRTAGGPEIFEVYRIPANGIPLDEQDLSLYPERLQREGTWLCDLNEFSILHEQMNGNFDEIIDEIDSQMVEKLYAQWVSSEWPGR